MGFLGFKSSKEVEEEKRKAAGIAKEQVIRNNYANLSNLSKGSQVRFAIPFFDVFDPRLMDTGVPVAVHGTIVYAIEDMDMFRSINKTEGFCDETFQTKLKGTVTKYVKSVISNAPSESQIPAVQLERKIVEISDMVQNYVAPKVENLFGIKVRSLDITSINIDKNSPGFRQLRALTADLEKDNILAKHNAELSNFNLNNKLQQDVLIRQQEMNLGGQEEMQRMQLENQREIMRIQREEMQRASRLQTEQTFLGAHQANLNAEMGIKSANTGMMGNTQMPGLGGMPKMGQVPSMPQAVPQVQYMIGINGQQAGPFDWNQLKQLVQQGQLTLQTYVWKQGMLNWEFAGNVQELAPLFRNTTPQMPGMPPTL
jgi:hypothetical protein